MPELPEVETVVRDLRPLVAGCHLTSITVSKQALRKKWSSAWKRELVGQQVQTVLRRGKWIGMQLDRGWTLVIHLGMTGQLTAVPTATPRQTHTHVVFALDDGQRELRFRDIRRFGSATLYDTAAALEKFFTLAKLGAPIEPSMYM